MLTQAGLLIKELQDELYNHVAANVAEFGDYADRLQEVAGRTSLTETRVEGLAQSLSQVVAATKEDLTSIVQATKEEFTSITNAFSTAVSGKFQEVDRQIAAAASGAHAPRQPGSDPVALATLGAELTTLENRVAGLEAHLQQLPTGTGAATGGPGNPNTTPPDLAKVKEARPADKGFGGERAKFPDFRLDVVNWASRRFADVGKYLDWAYSQTVPISAVAIAQADPTGEMREFDRQFRRELWSFLTPESEARHAIKSTGTSEGLESWRLLAQRCKPQGAQQAMLDIQRVVRPTPVHLNSEVPDAISRWKSELVEYESITGTNPLPDARTRMILATSLMPKQMKLDLLKDMHGFRTFEDLEVRATGYALTIPTDSKGPTPMELGQVDHAAVQPPPGMSALISPGKGNWSGQPPPDPYKGSKGGKGAKGKGKAGGKGVNFGIRLGQRRATENGSIPICREFARTGRCGHFERTGYKCRFQHIRNIPEKLSSVEGLIASDFPNSTYDPKEEVHTAADNLDTDAVLADIERVAAVVQAEDAQLAAIQPAFAPRGQQPGSSSDGPQASPGFHWPSH